MSPPLGRIKKKKNSKTVARPYVTLRKKVSAQAYPREHVHLVYLHIRAQGVGRWVADTTRASKLQYFFVPVPFFLTQVRQVKVVFLRTLRNAATRLTTTGLEAQVKYRS